MIKSLRNNRRSPNDTCITHRIVIITRTRIIWIVRGALLNSGRKSSRPWKQKHRCDPNLRAGGGSLKVRPLLLLSHSSPVTDGVYICVRSLLKNTIIYPKTSPVSHDQCVGVWEYLNAVYTYIMSLLPVPRVWFVYVRYIDINVG